MSNRERREFAAMQSKQAYTRLRTIKPIRNTFKAVEGQISLTDTQRDNQNNIINYGGV